MYAKTMTRFLPRRKAGFKACFGVRRLVTVELAVHTDMPRAADGRPCRADKAARRLQRRGVVALKNHLHWTARRIGVSLQREQNMIGPILVFLAVCALVAIYMAIVRTFLRASEKHTDAEQEIPEVSASEGNRESSHAESRPRQTASPQPQWAH
jgi:hypothetical protein